MTTPISPDADPIAGRWRDALATGPDCLPIERLAAPLDARDQAHVDGCVRCQTERALVLEFEANAPVEGEGVAVAWIANDLKRRRGGSAAPARAPARGMWAVPRWALVAASVLVVVAAGGLLWRPAPTIDRDAPGTVYRSARVEVESPQGDVPAAPAELRWASVASAAAYDVRLFEVDGTELWRVETSAPFVALPPDVAASALPAKTLVWSVIAKDAAGRVVAESGPTRFRVQLSRP